jgi:hypothetical protein
VQSRKQRIARRLEQADRSGTDRPEMAASNIQYEIADRTRAISGIGAAHLLVKWLGLDQAINERLDLLKVYLPYHESDHILNIAYNLLAGGTRLEHLEFLRNDEGYLDALGATRIPDPTTAGDFCRRFDEGRIDTLQEVFNDARVKVWSEQAAVSLDRTVALCRRAGFRQVRLRGDTDFSQTEHLDRWSTDGVTFVFGIQAMQSLYVHAENLPLRRAFMAVPAQIISTGRRIVFRLLSWNPWQHVFFRLLDQLRTPLRC